MSDSENRTAGGNRHAIDEGGNDRVATRPSLEPTPQAKRRGIILLIAALIVAAVIVVTGILPRVHARGTLRRQTDSMAVPTVAVVMPKQGEPMQEVVLPGTIQAYKDTPIYARTNGYVKMWSHDIGSHVHAGELLAVIETPELDRQVDQARATLVTAQANLGLSQTTAKRYQGLRGSDAVSKQSIDTAVDTANAQNSTVVAAQQSLNQLLEMQSFERITAPFDGIVTVRNIDVGQLVDAGSAGGTGSAAMYGGNTTAASTPRELFHVSDIRTARIFIDVPEVDASEARPGVKTTIEVSEYPGRIFTGTIVRTANAIDLNTRTLRVEVDIDNRKGELLPGAYAQVHLKLPMKHPALIIPVSSLMFRAEGLRVATVDGDNRAHLEAITVGRDWGTQIEVLTGLTADQRIIDSPPDSVVDDERVRVVSGSNGRSGASGDE